MLLCSLFLITKRGCNSGGKVTVGVAAPGLTLTAEAQLFGTLAAGGAATAPLFADDIIRITDDAAEGTTRFFNTITGCEVNAAGDAIEGGGRILIEAGTSNPTIRVFDDVARGGASSGGADDAGREVGQIIGQLTENSCGPACLQTLLREGGTEVDQLALANRAFMDFATPGTNPGDLARAANAILDGELWQGGALTPSQVDTLIDSGRPVITLLDAQNGLGHFVIVRGRDSGGRLIVDNLANGGFREFLEPADFAERAVNRGTIGVLFANGGKFGRAEV